MALHWEQNYADKRGATIVERIDDIIRLHAQTETVHEVANSRQLSLDFV